MIFFSLHRCYSQNSCPSMDKALVPSIFDEAACTGIESRLIDCPFDSTHDCTHAEDAGVDCSAICKCAYT